MLYFDGDFILFDLHVHRYGYFFFITIIIKSVISLNWKVMLLII